MTPNLLIPFLYLNPRRWPTAKPEGRQQPASSQHRDTPVKGLYRHYTGRGWYLVEERYHGDEDEITQYEYCIARRVVYSLVLHRWLFESDFNNRCCQGYLPFQVSSKSLERGRKRSHIDNEFTIYTVQRNKLHREVGFFQMDDKMTWVQCYDKHGNFLEGPWKRYVVDFEDDRGVHFREMLKTDSRQASARTSRSTTPSRNKFHDHDRYSLPDTMS